MGGASEIATGEEGITLIEVLVAAFVLVLGAMAVFMTFAASIHNVQRGKEMQQAVSVAQREMELVRSEPYADVGLEGTLAPAAGQTELPTSRLAAEGREFDVNRTGSAQYRPIVAGGLEPELPEVSSTDGTKVTVYRFVVCESPELVADCPAKRVVIDVLPTAADNQGGYRHSYYELQSTIVNPEGES